MKTTDKERDEVTGIGFLPDVSAAEILSGDRAKKRLDEEAARKGKDPVLRAKLLALGKPKTT